MTTWKEKVSRLDNEAFILLSETYRTSNHDIAVQAFDLLEDAEKRLTTGEMQVPLNVWGPARVDALTIEEVRVGLNSGKIPAIKLFRERVGVGLKDSKEAVEKFFAAAGLTFYTPDNW